MREVDSQVNVVLGHLTETKFLFAVVFWRQTDYYATFAVPAMRPAEDKTLIEVHCPTCDQELLVRVDSVERTRSKRRTRFRIALVAFCVAVLSVLIGVGAEYAGVRIPLGSPLGVVLLLGFLLGALVAGVAGLFCWEQDGVHLYTVAAESDRFHWRLDGFRPHRNTI